MKNNVIKIEHTLSPGLSKEINSIDQCYLEVNQELIKNYPDIGSYINNYFQTFWGLELKEQIKKIKKPAKILDIGAGRGESSIYLASLGFEVSCAEPAYSSCQAIKEIANKFDIPINIYQCSAEHINDIPDKNFDICIFNNSLHHCDDPFLALKNCYDILKKGGSIYLMNEIFLKIHKSKKSFYKFMANNHKKSGNYGGNEHAYYYYEYVKMLKDAKFDKIIEHIPFRYANPRIVASNLKTILGQRYNLIERTSRIIYFYLLNKLISSIYFNKNLLPQLKKSGLIQITFEGVK